MVYLVLLLIVSSYFVSTITLNGLSLKIFQSIWVISIISLSWVFGNPNIDLPQIGFLFIFLITSYYFVLWFNKTFNLHTKKYMIYSSVIAAPILEEFFFRGWLQNAITGSDLQKIAICSILFGLYHIKNYKLMEKNSYIFQILYAGLIVGPILGFAAITTNSVFFPIIIHSINNTLAKTISRLFFPFLNRWKEETKVI